MTTTIAAINPAAAGAAVQTLEPRALLQPGSVVDARVLQVMDGGQVRIAIANMVLDVLSEAQLTAGANLRLAVSASADGIRLAIQPQANTAQGGVQAMPAQTGDVSGAGRALATGAASSPAQLNLSTQEARSAAALMQAVSNAATRQSGLSPLFANVSAALAQTPLPPQVQQAALALLALRVPLDGNLNGAEVEKAVGQSGIFLESKLAGIASGNGAFVQEQSAGNLATSDLKAALSVLRQALAGSLGTALPDAPENMTGTQASPAPDPGKASLPAGPARTDPASAAQTPALQGAAQASARETSQIRSQPGPNASPATAERQNQVVAQAASNMASHGTNAKAGDGEPIRITGSLGVAAQASLPSPTVQVANTTLLVLAQGMEAPLNEAAMKSGGAGLTAQAMLASQAGPLGSELLAPPLRDAAPMAQPVALPSLAPDGALEDIARQLLKDTDGALARQTLLQAASLPDARDAGLPRMDTAQTRLHFEIPFATGQGTAIAQFEIEEDGGGNAVAAETEKAWRARFTLNTEAAGPVHVMVTLAGQRTSVRMWAERDETAAQLRGHTEDLSASLARAELQPGDISVKQGAPPQRAKTAPPGHFLDRAT